MWQICGHIRKRLLVLPGIACIVVQLSVSFFMEPFILAKNAHDGALGGVADETIQRQPATCRPNRGGPSRC